VRKAKNPQAIGGGGGNGGGGDEETDCFDF